MTSITPTPNQQPAAGQIHEPPTTMSRICSPESTHFYRAASLLYGAIAISGATTGAIIIKNQTNGDNSSDGSPSVQTGLSVLFAASAMAAVFGLGCGCYARQTDRSNSENLRSAVNIQMARQYLRPDNSLGLEELFSTREAAVLSVNTVRTEQDAGRARTAARETNGHLVAANQALADANAAASEATDAASAVQEVIATVGQSDDLSDKFKTEADHWAEKTQIAAKVAGSAASEAKEAANTVGLMKTNADSAASQARQAALTALETGDENTSETARATAQTKANEASETINRASEAAETAREAANKATVAAENAKNALFQAQAYANNLYDDSPV